MSDPALDALVKAARVPLEVADDGGPLVVPEAVLDEVREAAAAVEPGREVAGVLRVVDHVVVGYTPLENLDDRPGRFRVRGWRRSGRDEDVLLHSHVSPSGCSPSAADLSGASRNRIAILHLATDSLHIWDLADDRRSFTGAAVKVIAAAPEAPASPVRDRAVEAQLAAMVESDERLRREAAKARPVTASADTPTTLLGEVSFVQPTGSGYAEVPDIVFVRRPQA